VTKKLFIFDNSKAPHHSSILGITDVFEKNNFEVSLCLGKFPLARMDGETLKERFKKVYYISSLSGIINFFKDYNKRDYIIFNTVSFRTVFFNFFITLFTQKNLFYVRNANSWLISPDHSSKLHHVFLGKLIARTKMYLLKNKAIGLISGSYNIKNY
jgi:hypothetical protein